MSQFFKALGVLMTDRQEFSLTATKIKEDLILMINSDVKGKGKITHITIPADDLTNDENLDSKIFGELTSTTSSDPVKFQSSTTTAPETEEEDEKPDPVQKKAAPKKSKPEGKKAKAAREKQESIARTSALLKKGVEIKTDNELQVEEGEQSVVSSESVSYENPTPTDETITTEVKDNTEEIARLLSVAADSKKQSKYKSALNRYNEVLALDPNNEEAKAGFELATEKLKAREEKAKTPTEEIPAPTAEVKGETVKAAEPDPKELFAYFMDEGKKQFEARNWQESMEAYSTAIDLDPNNPKAIEGYRQSKMWVNAVAATKKTVQS